MPPVGNVIEESEGEDDDGNGDQIDVNQLMKIVPNRTMKQITTEKQKQTGR